MTKSDSYDSKLSQARGLASQLGMFAEENDIPKIFGIHWKLLFMIFMKYLMIDKNPVVKASITKIKKF